MAFLSQYKVITVTHHQLNVNELGHFYIKGDDQAEKSDRLHEIQKNFGISEALYLETCNRVTYILYSEQGHNDEFLKKFFLAVNPALENDTMGKLHNFVSTYEGDAAVRHVFELASSMDSLVVGEREIFRQLRQAYLWSKENGHIGDNIRLLQRATVKTAKKIYHNTKIGEKPLSVVSLAMNALLKSHVKRDSKILLIGAGETNALVGKFLKKYAFTDIKIYNRSLHNAAELSKELSAESYHIHDLKNVEGEFDIIFTCTSANKVILDDNLYKDMLGGDESEKTIIDLAVPRNVSPAVIEKNKVRHIDIEALKKLSELNLEFRMHEMEKARPMIFDEIKDFNALFQERQIEKALVHIPPKITAVKERAIHQVYNKRMATLDPDSKALVMEMMDYMEKKCISIPIKMAKKV